MPVDAALSGDATVDSKEPEAQPAPAGPDPESFFKENAQPEAAPGAGDPFSALDQAKAKEDFDSAFASFKAGSGSKGLSDAAEPVPAAADTAKGFSTFSTEFPPISELERTDDSDSEDEQGGFDDDFAPSSPNAKPADKPGSPTLNKTVAADAPSPAVDEEFKEADDIFGNAPPPGSFPDATPLEEPPSSVTPTVAQPSLSKQSSAFDDLDDDFADLEDAKEGSQDDDFQTISRSGLDEFNPTFDSPPPAAKAESTAPPGSSSGNAPTFGSESTFDFASIDNTASQTSTAPPAEGAAKPAENHDWDAIFASLDDAPPATTSASPPPPGSPASGGGAVTASAPAPAAETSKESLRPDGPGRALTEDGTHDDPILKNLTSMGYTRTDALNALEKYDYNLERVS